MRFLLSLLLVASAVHAADPLSAFPPAGEGRNRFVITLPSQDDEDLLKVQLIVGKNVKIDSQNRYFFGGKIETEAVPGWGYECYVVKALGPMAGTLMAVDPNEPKHDCFITLGGDPELLRYNSRLPLVIYVPNGLEVRYRIWRAEGRLETAAER